MNEPLTATEVLVELTDLASRNVGARACLREFLDQDPVVAALNVDWLATNLTGETIYCDKPSEGLQACLATCRTLDGHADFSTAVVAHE
jgi:hypothetical protein